MANAWKFHFACLTLACLTLACLLATAGCGSKGAAPEATTAAISGANTDSAGTATAGPVAKTPQPPVNPVVVIQTTLGDIVVELDARAAPTTTDEFLNYVRRKHYDGTIFHQVIKGQVAAVVGGQYQTDLTAKPGRTAIQNEAAKAANAGLHNVSGTIAMMRDPMVQDSATCQFFINVNDNPVLDHKGTRAEEYGYCPFGRVRQGMDVIDKIAHAQVSDSIKDKKGRAFEQMPVEQIVINRIVIR